VIPRMSLKPCIHTRFFEIPLAVSPPPTPALWCDIQHAAHALHPYPGYLKQVNLISINIESLKYINYVCMLNH
jgi:hypothetical protein